MNKIIIKIVDDVQYKLNKSYQNINLIDIVENQSKKLIGYNKFNIFDSVDAVELNKNILSNYFYIFPVFYTHEESSLELPNFWYSSVSTFIEKNINLLTQKNVVVLICDPLEASVHLKENVERLQTKYNINFWLLTADKQINSNNFKIIYNNAWSQKFDPWKNVIEYVPKKLYINLTRVARYHRCRLLEHLIENNLLKHGYNSWGDTYKAFSHYVAQHPDTKINPKMFNLLDIKDLSSINPNFNVPIKHCKRSFLFLTTETHANSNTMFFSEKAYKPIGIGMPFITLGNPGTLQELQAAGYITFDEWFDESYDYNFDLEKRIQIIIKNLKKYSKYTNDDLIKIRKEMNEVVNYNLNLYKIIKTKNTLREKINQYRNDQQ